MSSCWQISVPLLPLPSPCLFSIMAQAAQSDSDLANAFGSTSAVRKNYCICRGNEASVTDWAVLVYKRNLLSCQDTEQSHCQDTQEGLKSACSHWLSALWVLKQAWGRNCSWPSLVLRSQTDKHPLLSHFSQAAVQLFPGHSRSQYSAHALQLSCAIYLSPRGLLFYSTHNILSLWFSKVH